MSVWNEDRGALVLLAGGILLVVSLFLQWETGYSAWDAFSNLRVIILLVGIFAIGFSVLEALGAGVSLPDLIPLVIAGLGLAVFGFAAGWELQISGAGGVWCAIVGSFAIAIGAYAARRHDLVVRSELAQRRGMRAPGAGATPPGEV